MKMATAAAKEVEMKEKHLQEISSRWKLIYLCRRPHYIGSGVKIKRKSDYRQVFWHLYFHSRAKKAFANRNWNFHICSFAGWKWMTGKMNNVRFMKKNIFQSKIFPFTRWFFTVPSPFPLHFWRWRVRERVSAKNEISKRFGMRRQKRYFIFK